MENSYFVISEWPINLLQLGVKTLQSQPALHFTLGKIQQKSTNSVLFTYNIKFPWGCSGNSKIPNTPTPQTK